MFWNNIFVYMKIFVLFSSLNLCINKVVKLILLFIGFLIKCNLNFRISIVKWYMCRVNLLILFFGYKYLWLYICCIK